MIIDTSSSAQITTALVSSMPTIQAEPSGRTILLTKIPDEDSDEFSRLPDDIRKEIRIRLALVAEIARASSVTTICRVIAERLHNADGYSAQRLRALFYAYRADPDWRRLANKNVAKELAVRQFALHPNFRTFVHSFLMLNQRGKARERYRALIARLHSWRLTGRTEFAIPGYSAPPPDAPGANHPAGWSYRTLIRLAPTPFEQTAMSIGRGAASEFRPKVMTTRVGLKPGQIVFFDDQVHDVRVNFVGNRRKVQRPLELVCMDCFSACFVGHGFKPTVWNDITETRVMLRQDDMIWFAMNWLLNVGWREDTGTKVICEHGTAAFPEWMREKIQELSGGKITFTAGGVDRRASFAALFDGPARGNFRIKAGLESAFNLVRNETSDMTLMPGQVGKDRLHSPEEWEARMKSNETLLMASAALPQELAIQLRYPFLEWSQFLRLALAIYDAIDSRTTHELEGWREAGLVANEWRMTQDSPWVSINALLDLSPEKQATACAITELDPANLQRTRKLSPKEVWSRGAGELKKAPGFWIALMLPKEMGVERTVQTDHLFEFEDQEISTGPLRFLAEIGGRYLRPGEVFNTFINPFRPSELYVCDAKHRFIGTARAWTAESKSDIEAIHRKCGEAAKIEKQLLAPVARAGAELSRQRMEDAQHNARLLGPVKQDLSGVRNIGELLDEPEDTPKPEEDAKFSMKRLLRRDTEDNHDGNT